MPGHGLVDRVVDDLVDQVVQPAGTGGPDVHPGPQADVFDTLEDLDVLGRVGTALIGRCCHASSDLTRRTAAQSRPSRGGCRAGGFPAPSIPCEPPSRPVSTWPETLALQRFQALCG